MTRLKIDYVEFGTADMKASRAFMEKAFDWVFQDYGPDYAAMINSGVDGGIFKPEGDAPPPPPLVVLKADNLDAAEKDVRAAGGTITTPIFSFPGGRRFHFSEPGGIEMAVWGP